MGRASAPSPGLGAPSLLPVPFPSGRGSPEVLPLQSPGRTEACQAPSCPGLLPVCSLTTSPRLGGGWAPMPTSPASGPSGGHASTPRCKTASAGPSVHSGHQILGSEVAGPGLKLQAAEPTEPSGSSGCFLLVAPQNL